MGSRGKDHAGQREVSWAAEAAGLAMKEAGQMQNLESEGAGRSVSTQTGSMTGECPESSRHSPFALLCASPAVSLWVPCLAVFACVSAPGCPIPALGASLPRSPESLGPAALAFEVALTTPLYFSSQDLELGSTSLQIPQTVFFIRFQNYPHTTLSYISTAFPSKVTAFLGLGSNHCPCCSASSQSKVKVAPR